MGAKVVFNRKLIFDSPLQIILNAGNLHLLSTLAALDFKSNEKKEKVLGIESC